MPLQIDYETHLLFVLVEVGSFAEVDVKLLNFESEFVSLSLHFGEFVLGGTEQVLDFLVDFVSNWLLLAPR